MTTEEQQFRALCQINDIAFTVTHDDTILVSSIGFFYYHSWAEALADTLKMLPLKKGET